MWTKNGSIPQPETDGTEGWIEVPDMPECPANKEVVWWYPPGWVIRDPQPAPDYSWSQSEEKWVQYVAPVVDVTQTVVSADLSALSSANISALSTAQISAL